ncbi:hypothetical protein [Nocardia cyriacigeorgica]|uniref:hypothetical protein n=1 Tax=Nocardia cyriacigeorgica TaxID=135487 RepID=UPI002455BE08|nr:hypothetical protein [Nocardia cyriacigeorgica]
MTVTKVKIVRDADPASEIFTAVMYALMYAVAGAAIAVHWALLFPMISLPIAAAIAAGVLWGWPFGIGVAGISGAGIMLWRLRRPEMFERWVTRRARTRFLAWWRYRVRWNRKLTACGLAIIDGDATRIPRLLSVAIGEHSDRVRVRMLDGQCPADYDNRTSHLCHAFGALDCHADLLGRGVYELTFRRSDALAETVVLPRVDHWTKKEAA